MVRGTGFVLNSVAMLMAISIAGRAGASPPPPPPPFADEIAKVLVPTQTEATFAAYADKMADDLSVWIDGHQVAANKTEWIGQERHRLGKVDRHVYGHAVGRNSVLVFERFDDRSDLPDNPTMLFDPRYLVRSVQYQFGPDEKVHVIRISAAEYPLITP